MEFRYLRSFVYVAETLSFSIAATHQGDIEADG